MKRLLLGIFAAGALCFLAAPLWAQCPAAGFAPSGCNDIITIQPGAGSTFTITTGAGGATPNTNIDAGTPQGGATGDDVMVGIVNNSGQFIYSLTLTGTSDIFGFDGDGACSGYTGVPPNSAFASPASCAGGPNEYFPAGLGLAGVNTQQTSGTIFFTTPLAPGAQAWISLENFAGVTGVAATPEPGTLAMLGSALLGIVSIVRRRLFNSGE